MNIKLYGMTRKFPDGDGGEIVFKASGNLYPFYKSFTGKDLMAAYDDYITISQKNGKEIETKTGMPFDDFKKLTVEEKTKKIAEAKIKIDDNGTDFINSAMLALYLNSLTPQDQTEALAAGLDCLPPAFYTDLNIMQSVIELLTQFMTGIKKN